MSWSIFVDFGTGDQDITEHCGKVSRNRTAHKDLRSTINTCHFEVYDKTVANQFNTATDDMPLTIEKDGANYFVGMIRPTYKSEVSSDFKKLTVEGYDRGVLLQKSINQTLAYQNYKVCNPSSKSTSIIHQLFYEAGIADSELDLSLIDKTIDWFVIEREDKTTYRDQINLLLFEFGYIYDCRPSGLFELIDIFPSSLSGTLIEDSDMYGETGARLKYERKESAYEAVRVTWHPHDTLTGELLFSDTTGGTDESFCDISLGAGEWYPDGSDTEDVYSKFELDGYELITVSNHNLDWENSGVTLNTETHGNKRSLIKFYSASGGTITKFNITGDAVVRDLNDIRKSVRYNVVDTEKIKEIEARHITDANDAKKLANGVSDWYRYSNFKYTFETIDSYDPGDILELDSDIMEFDTHVRIIEIVEDEFDNIKIVAEGITAYSLNDVDIENEITSPRAVITTRQENDRMVSKVEHQIGFTDTPSGGTQTPTQVTIATCKAVGTHSILLIWDRQLNLTNFDHYEAQVSDDNGVTWYSLKFDGTDWKDTLDDTTDVLSEFLVHSGIPHTGDADTPSGKQLYYRVRRVTKAPANGTWSATANATANTVGAGDLAADSIYANNMIAAQIQTLFLKVSDHVYVGYNGTGTYDSPDEGDRVNYIDLDEYTLYEYTGGAWVVRLKIGGAIAGLFLAATSCVLVYHPDNPPDSAELFPGSNYRIFNFENNAEDHLGVDDWLTKTPDPPIFSSTYKKFGTYSLYANATDISYLFSITSWGTIGLSENGGAWIRPVYVSGSPATNTIISLQDVSGNNRIHLAVRYVSSKWYVQLTIRKNTTYTVIDATTELTDNAWNYIAFSYNSVTNTAYLISNNIIYSDNPTGTWGSGNFQLSIIAVNNTTHSHYIDELVIAPDQYITPNIWAQHYNHNVVWNTDYGYKDTSFRPASGGIVKADADTEVTGQLKITGVSCVRVTSTAGQSIPDAAWTKIVFGTETEDNLGEWSSDTFTGLQAGRYLVSCMALFTGAAFSLGNYALLGVYVDNAFHVFLDREEFQVNLAGYTPALSGTKIVEIDAGGTIDIRVYQNEGAARSLTSSAGYVWLDIHRLS